jgi:N-acetyl-anhydromuramyl-L-alanine amidase AmpD
MVHDKRVLFLLFPLFLVCMLVLLMMAGYFSQHRASAAGFVDAAFTQAAHESGVPIEILKSICYMEGRLSNHAGSPSVDQGYGCMHLTKNAHVNMLDQAARELRVNEQQLKTDLPTNIRGGAILLHDEALQLSKTHRLPATLAGWYGAIATYSHATTRSTALMYADEVYHILQRGFSAKADNGEVITLAAQTVKPDLMQAVNVKGATSLPAGCVNDGKVDYPNAIDCILNPKTFDCNRVRANAPCTYQSAVRPAQYKVLQVVIHDIEGTARDALNVFQNVKSNVSVQYIVDSDGTIYQVLRDHDIGFHAGNLWYNQHSVGIEHAGFAAAGWQWYNATEYLASAKLTAYLLEKYHIPLDHDHVVAHGTIPASALAYTPNHVDPGPYWLWDYYLGLVHEQGVPYAGGQQNDRLITLQPATGHQSLGDNGQETQDNFNFFYLYSAPSTDSPRIQPAGNAHTITDETNNVEADMSFYYLDKVDDPAGTGDTLYEIWYGEEDQAHSAKPSYFAHAKLAWLAVPPDAATQGYGTPVTLKATRGASVSISGKPATGSVYVIGSAPQQAVFVSAYTVVEDGTHNQWYEINYNHRQAWVPANNVQIVRNPPPEREAGLRNG